MRQLSDKSQIVETREIGHTTFEVCATSVANYDDEVSELEITFDSFVRRVNPRGPDESLHPDWLPCRDVIRHRMSIGDAMEETNQAFTGWAQKVRHSIPSFRAFEESLERTADPNPAM